MLYDQLASRRTHRRHLVFLLMLSSAASLACATARINDFKEFSKLGAVYADATSSLMDEAAVTSINANSAILGSRHADLSAERRQDEMLAQNELLATRVQLLRDLQRHAKVLKSYFAALGALAESDAATEIGKSAGNVATAAQALGAQLEGGSVAGTDVATFLAPAVRLTVTQFQRRALEAELEARAASIDHELNIQQAATAVIAETMREDQLHIQQSREIELTRAFRADKLPKDWEKQRLDVLLVSPNVKAAQQAVEAAKNLRLSFQALVEGRFDVSDLATMMSDFGEYVALVETIEANRNAG